MRSKSEGKDSGAGKCNCAITGAGVFLFKKADVALDGASKGSERGQAM